MDAQHRAGLLAGAAGLVLLIAMFLPWFGASEAQERAIKDAQEITQRFGGEPVDPPDLTANAWQAFGFVKYVLLLTVLIGILTGVLALLGPSGPSRMGLAGVTAGVGILASLLVLYRVINPVGESGREFGLFLGFFAALGVAVGGWLALERGTSTRDGPKSDSLASPRDE